MEENIIVQTEEDGGEGRKKEMKLQKEKIVEKEEKCRKMKDGGQVRKGKCVERIQRRKKK